MSSLMLIPILQAFLDQAGPGNGQGMTPPDQGQADKNSKNKKPANADGSTKSDNSQENNPSKTTNS